jgi:hypothetical protein
MGNCAAKSPPLLLKPFVYLAKARVFNLYRQLPEGKVVGVKTSKSTSQRGLYDMAPGGETAVCEMKVTHLGQERAESNYREQYADKHEIYQLEAVLKHLRKNAMMDVFDEDTKARRGKFYEIRNDFTVHEIPNTSDFVLLQCQEPKLKLICAKSSFYGEGGESSYVQYFLCCNSIRLDVSFFVVCAPATGETVCGIPLFMAL